MRCNVALSGGGTRAIGHLGVLKALLEHGLCINALSGSSGGAIIGALLASGKSVDEAYELVMSTNFSALFSLTIGHSGFFSLTRGEKRLKEMLGYDLLEALPIKLTVCAVALEQGKIVYFDRGNLAKSVIASSSIPPFMKPVRIEGVSYIDGGIMNNLPLEPFLSESLPIIGINVNPNTPMKKNSITGLTKRALFLQFYGNIESRKHHCSYYFEPPDIGAYSIYDTKSFERVFLLSYEWCKKELCYNKNYFQITQSEALE